MIMPVGSIQIGMFQECRGRKQEVGIIGSIGLKMFENNGEKIVTL